MALLNVENLRTSFHTRNGIVRAVGGVSFHVEKGEALGIVGESGSGKSVTFYSLMGLIPKPPGRIEGGTAMFDGVDLLKCSDRKLNQIRGRRVAMIFQDPMTSLNPYLRIESQLIEPLVIHGMADRKSARKKAIRALEAVGIQDAARRIRYHPHQFSGGMRQRVMIAMALITEPDLLIADEPTTALDVTVQAQILELIKKMQQDLGTAVVLVSHDLGVVSGFCDRVHVMYAGRIVEAADTVSIFKRPRHPYNRALQQSIPAMHARKEALYTIPGMPPDLSRDLPGCPFAPRCDRAAEYCSVENPDLLEVSKDHYSECMRVQRKEIEV